MLQFDDYVNKTYCNTRFYSATNSIVGRITLGDECLGQAIKIDTSFCSANNNIAAGRSNDEIKVDNGSFFGDYLMLIQVFAWPAIDSRYWMEKMVENWMAL